MKRLLVFLMLIYVTPLWAGPILTKNNLLNSTTAGGSLDERGTGINYHVIRWNTPQTVTACTVKLEQSINGATWTDLIAATSCTSSGSSSVTSGVANFIRAKLATYTGTGTVEVFYGGYIDVAAGISGGTGTSGQVAFFDSPSTVSGDVDLTFDSTTNTLSPRNVSTVADYTNLGSEVLSQTTFAPAHDKWAVTGDLAFVGNVSTYTASMAGTGDLFQDDTDFNTVPTVGNYRFSWTLSNVVAGNIECFYSIGGYAELTVANGTNTLDFYLNDKLVNLSGFLGYLYCTGTSGSFKITNISVKRTPTGVISSTTVATDIVSATVVESGNGTEEFPAIHSPYDNTSGFFWSLDAGNPTGNIAYSRYGVLKWKNEGDQFNFSVPVLYRSAAEIADGATYTDSYTFYRTSSTNIRLKFNGLDSVIRYHDFGLSTTAGDSPFNGRVTAPLYASTTNCADSAGAAACGAAPAGTVVIDASATSVVVSTTAVTANSQIFVQDDSSNSARLSVTCNTQALGVLGTPRVTARTAATSFTISVDVGPTTDPLCLNYWVVN